jgi:hypothetical protein
MAAVLSLSCLLVAACASNASPSAGAAGGSSAQAVAQTGGSGGLCTGDTVAASFQTAYDGTLPLCTGFAGDADHAGEGLAGTELTGGATEAGVKTVTQWALLHARAIYSFQPPAAWLAAHPHPRDVNGLFHRQTTPAVGDTALRAYKDYITPAPGQAGNEQDYALFSVIVSPGPQTESARNATEGGVWFVGCLVYHADGREYLETCPSWVWTVPVVPSAKRKL